MPVLVEAHSIIVRCDAIHDRYAGGWEQFLVDVPNQTLCSDGEIARVGFMGPADAHAYINYLGCRGLLLCEKGATKDVAAVFQLDGLTVPCLWLEFGRTNLPVYGPSAVLTYCRLLGGTCTQLTTPANWKYEGSLSQTYGIFPATACTGAKFLRHDDGVDVYHDCLSGKEIYVGRTGE